MNFGDFLNALFPPRCAGCNADNVVLCASCLPAPSAQRRAGLGRFPVDALGPYAGALRSTILAFKRGRRDAGVVLARLAAERLFAANDDGAVLVPVPTTRPRRGVRGFDQGLFLAGHIARLRGLPAICALRQTAGDAQRGRSRAERLRARGRFSIVGASIVAGSHVVLVDDVMTTGATLLDCAATLERAGARVSRAIVLARAESRGPRDVSCRSGGQRT